MASQNPLTALGPARLLSRTRSRGGVSTAPRRGMSLVEILAVIGIILVLIAILLPGLSIARKNALWARSQSNLRQIHTYLIAYAGDHRETIVPAAFDYSSQIADPRVKVRTPSPLGQNPPVGLPRQGSWSDILWTVNDLGALVDTEDPDSYNYRYDSPDRVYFEKNPDDTVSVFRSVAAITKAVDGTDALPFGTGTQRTELGDPGYFAANEFFDVRPATVQNPGAGKWWVTGQIVRPAQSVYLVDSYGGEITQTSGSDADSYQIDWIDHRYTGDVALLLCLDGHIESQPEWDSLRDLEELRQLRFRALDRQRPFYEP